MAKKPDENLSDEENAKTQETPEEDPEETPEEDPVENHEDQEQRVKKFIVVKQGGIISYCQVERATADRYKAA